MKRKNLSSLSRWLHIYLSMLSFTLLLFFAITGITLNHTSWFRNQQKVERNRGVIDSTLISAGPGGPFDTVAIASQIRKNHNIRARLSDFRAEDSECSISFAGPGYGADAFIDRSSGTYEITITRAGFAAVINDIHKGRDTGSGWITAIDVSAILMLIVSLSGFLMIFFISRRRTAGLLISLIGTIIFLAACIYLI